MKQKNKSLLLSGFLIIFLLFILAACGDTGTSVSTPQQEQEEQPGQQNETTLPQDTSLTKPTIQGSELLLVDATSANRFNEEIGATAENQSILRVKNGGAFTANQTIFTKSGDTTSQTESGLFGLNAAIIAETGGTITLEQAVLHSEATGSTAVFANGAGSTAKLTDVAITTAGDASPGLGAVDSGSVIADGVNIATTGLASAGLTTGWGNGTCRVDNAVINTNGTDSPAIVAAGVVSVMNSHLTATNAPGATVTDNGSLLLYNCQLTGGKESGISFYQTTTEPNITNIFNATNGNITAQEGALFYATNSHVDLQLKEVSLLNESFQLLHAAADTLGKEGANGATISLTATKQTLPGNVTADALSSVALTLLDNSTLRGAMNHENTAKSASLSLDKSSTWQITGDSYLTVFQDEDTTFSNIKDKGFTIYYDAQNAANQWLAGKTYTLNEGGTLQPFK